jgi:hypothetical protein
VTSASGNQPDWVRDPYAAHNRQLYVAAVGLGSTRETAEKNALGNLVAIFGQNIQVDERVSLSYQEAVKSGAAAKWSESIAVDTGIVTSAGMDFLVGAEIASVWDDGAGTHHALAVLNKTSASRIYSGLILSNQALIDNLVDIPPEEKNTLGGLARYQFAAVAADLTIPYVNLLSVIGRSTPAFKHGDDYRLEARNIARTIPVALEVKNDRAGRIHGAFAKALSELGFLSGGKDSPYKLDANISTAPVEIANNQNKFTRIEVRANLLDARTGTVLLPFNFNSRQGHLSQSEADNRAYAAAEQKISEEYVILLKNYLSQLLPR